MAIYKDWFGNTFPVKFRNGYSKMRGAGKCWVQLTSVVDYYDALYLRKEDLLKHKQQFLLEHCMDLYSVFLSELLNRMEGLFTLYSQFKVNPKKKESEMMKAWIRGLLVLYIKEYTEETKFPDRETAEKWMWRIELLRPEIEDDRKKKREAQVIVPDEAERLRQEIEGIERGFRQMGYIVKFTGLKPGMSEEEKRKLYDAHWDQAEYNPNAWTCRKGSKRYERMLLRAEQLKNIRKTQKEMLDAKFLRLQQLLEIQNEDDADTRNRKAEDSKKLFQWFQSNALDKMFELEYHLDPEGQEKQATDYNRYEWDEMKRLFHNISYEKRSKCENIYFEERFSILWKIIKSTEIIDHEDIHEMENVIIRRTKELNRQAKIFSTGHKEYEQIVLHQNLRCYYRMDDYTIKLLFGKDDKQVGS
jgi:hypothetical protein